MICTDLLIGEKWKKDKEENKVGFIQTSAEFLEDGIPHIEMELKGD